MGFLLKQLCGCETVYWDGKDQWKREASLGSNFMNSVLALIISDTLKYLSIGSNRP